MRKDPEGDPPMNFALRKRATEHARPILAAAMLGWTILACAGCGSGGAATRSEAPGSGSMVGRAVPDMQLAGLVGGKGVRLSELRGKVVLLDIWASWCAPCKQELPMLDEMAGRLRSKGVEIVAVSVDDS